MARADEHRQQEATADVDWQRIYLLHKHALWREARRHMWSSTAADHQLAGVSDEDVVQQAFFEVMRSGRLPRDNDAARAYLLTIVRRRATDALRRSGRAVSTNHGGDANGPSAESAALDNISAKERKDQLLALVQDPTVLTANEREAFVVVVITGETRKSCAASMGVTPQRVSQLVAAAIRKLRVQSAETATEHTDEH